MSANMGVKLFQSTGRPEARKVKLGIITSPRSPRCLKTSMSPAVQEEVATQYLTPRYLAVRSSNSRTWPAVVSMPLPIIFLNDGAYAPCASSVGLVMGTVFFEAILLFPEDEDFQLGIIARVRQERKEVAKGAVVPDVFARSARKSRVHDAGAEGVGAKEVVLLLQNKSLRGKVLYYLFFIQMQIVIRRSYGRQAEVGTRGIEFGKSVGKRLNQHHAPACLERRRHAGKSILLVLPLHQVDDAPLGKDNVVHLFVIQRQYILLFKLHTAAQSLGRLLFGKCEQVF